MTHLQLQAIDVTLRSRHGTRLVEVRALDDAWLTVRAGETMGVIGPTGCGKSTLLRVIAGLIQPDAGKVIIDGQDQRGVPTRERGIGMVFQDYALYSHWNVWNNLAFYFRLRRRVDEVPARVHEAADILGVNFEYLLWRKPGHLSVGQRQQVAIARCLVRDPRLFLMDEPFANLDAAQRQRARLMLKRMLLRFKITTVHVTHDQQEAAALCDRVAFMEAGHIRQVDTFRNLLNWPIALDTAQFVTEPGSTFIEGACLEGHFACPAFSVPLPSHVLVRTSRGQGMTLRVRPGAVSPAPYSDAAAQPFIPVRAEVTWIEPLPMHRLQRVSCQAGKVPLTVELSQEVPVRNGEKIQLVIDPGKVDFFDTTSGANLALRAADAA
ncbi:MAG: ABC transporter ATP-binding protein [Chloroflexota bacterium]|nr:ABC transporter ATP-binding protein [Chloroflexota bacterium]